MSIETEFQSTIQNVQNAYNGLNNLGATIPQNKTIENIKSCLDEIYDNLPKTEYQEGTEVNLGKTLKGKLDYDNGVVGIGQTEQEIDLTENNLTSQSVNGLTITVNTDKSITINGTATANTSINLLNNTVDNTPATERTLVAGTYQLTGCPSGSESGTKFKLSVLRSGLIIVEDTGSGGVNTITSSQKYTYIRIYIFSGTVFNNLVFRPKLLKIPSPSYALPISCVTGNQDVVVSGKNYLPTGTKFTGGSNQWYDIDGNVMATLEQIQTSTNYIDLKPNTTYKFFAYEYNNIANMQVIYLDNTNTIKTYVNTVISTGVATFTTTDYTRVYVRVKASSSANDTYFIGQLEEGTSSTPYEPYITPKTYQLSLGDKKLYDECTIVGSPDNWKFVEKYGKVNANDFSFGIGSITISGQTYSQFSTPSNTPTILKGGLNTSDKVKCNKFLAGNNVIDTFYINSGRRIVVVAPILNGNYVTDIDTFNTIKSDMYIVGELNTPIETPITDATLISQLNAWYNAHSNNGTTIITSNGNLPMIIKVRGLKGA